ncbi:MAG: small multi-drug export protein [Lachnospiraceae bacterium]|jgi:uncharacterized membrane protein|nr:small multi-drug export protein [Lachnospiraceae bacterium]
MTAIRELLVNTLLDHHIAPEWICFIVSMIPLIELRGGLIVSRILNVSLWKAIIFCITGNIIPIPFILLFIKRILKWMKNIKFLGINKFANWLENRANKKSDALKKGEFLGLMLFVGIPIPGTGAWMGSLMAALFDIKLPKAVIAELCGLILATIIMSLLSYGALGSIFHFLG